MQATLFSGAALLVAVTHLSGPLRVGNSTSVPLVVSRRTTEPAAPSMVVGQPPRRTLLGPKRPVAALSGGASLDGRVLDARSGVALGGVALVNQDGEPLGASDEDGRFSTEELAASSSVAVDPSTGLATVAYGVLGGGGLWLGGSETTATTPTVVVAAARDLAGLVHTPAGDPVVGAKVFAFLPPHWSANVGATTEGMRARSSRAVTDANGEFLLEDVPDLAGVRLLVRGTEAWQRVTVVLPEGALAPQDVTLPSSPTLVDPRAGRVVDAAGNPLAGVNVAIGDQGLKTAEDGTFAFDGASVRPGDELRAVAAGKQMAMHVFAAGPDGGVAWPDTVELVLGEPALVVEGTVLDPSGAPVPRAFVQVLDPSPFGRIPVGLTLHAETVAARPTGLTVFTDAAGSFRLGGLCARSYELEARSLFSDDEARVTVDASAGIPLTIQLDSAPPRVDLAGVCVDATGTPRAGVTVAAVLRETPSKLFPGTVETTTSRAVVTGADGSFTLESIPPDVRLLLIGGDAAEERWALPTEAGPAALQVPVRRTRPLRIELGAAWSDCDAFEFRRAGALVNHGVPGQRNNRSRERSSIAQGRSGLVDVATDVDVLALFVAGELVLELPLQLQEGEDLHVVQVF